MKYLIAIVSACMLLISVPAFAEKPSWAGTGKPQRADVESHVDEMTSKHKDRARYDGDEDKKDKKDKDRDDDDRDEKSERDDDRDGEREYRSQRESDRVRKQADRVNTRDIEAQTQQDTDAAIERSRTRMDEKLNKAGTTVEDANGAVEQTKRSWKFWQN